MDFDTSERDGGKRIYSRLGPPPDRSRKVCFHWQAGRCNRHPCPFLHTDAPQKRANYSSPDDPHKFQAAGSGFARRNPNPNSTAGSNPNGHSSNWGRSRGGGGARIPPKSSEKICGYWLKGKCSYGDKCRNLHSWFVGETFSFLTLLEGHQKVVFVYDYMHFLGVSFIVGCSTDREMERSVLSGCLWNFSSLRFG